MEGFICKGCCRTKDGVVNRLGVILRHDDLSFIGFIIEEFSYRRDEKLKIFFIDQYDVIPR